MANAIIRLSKFDVHHWCMHSPPAPKLHQASYDGNEVFARVTTPESKSHGVHCVSYRSSAKNNVLDHNLALALIIATGRKRDKLLGACSRGRILTSKETSHESSQIGCWPENSSEAFRTRALNATTQCQSAASVSRNEPATIPFGPHNFRVCKDCLATMTSSMWNLLPSWRPSA